MNNYFFELIDKDPKGFIRIFEECKKNLKHKDSIEEYLDAISDRFEQLGLDTKFAISKDELGNMHILAMNDEAALALQIAYESSIEFNDLPHSSFEDDFSRILDFYSKHILSESTKSFIKFQLERVCRYWKQDKDVIYTISYLQ